MTCVRCKRDVPDEAAFCPWCGKRITPVAVHKRHRRRAKGSGTVYQLSGNRARPWVAAVRGKMLGTFATAGEAVDALDRFNRESPDINAFTATFAETYAAWSKSAFPAMGDKNKQGYENAYKKCPELHGKRMANLKTKDFQASIDALVKDGKSRSLCEKQRLLYSQLCQYAMAQDAMSKNYAALLKLPPQAAAKQRVLSDQELAKIKKAMGDEDTKRAAEIAYVLCYSGMRINELLHIQSKDVDLANRCIVGGEKTDAGKNRVIPIHKEIEPIVRGWMGAGSKWLLPSEADTPLDDSKVRKQFAALMRNLGIEDVSPHDCRRTAATKLVEAGVQPIILKNILGHKTLSVTAQYYARPRKEALVEGMDKVR